MVRTSLRLRRISLGLNLFRIKTWELPLFEKDLLSRPWQFHCPRKLSVPRRVQGIYFGGQVYDCSLRPTHDKKKGTFTFCAPSTTTNKNYLTADCRWLPATICFPCERAIIANFLFQLKEKNKQLAHNGYKIDQFWLCEASCRLVGTEDKTQSDQKVHGAKGKATKAAA